KGKRSVALVYYLLAREYLKERGEIKEDDDFDYEIDDFETEEISDEEE
ncbi:MAG: 30S ribosomal protein S2, partial [Candidatus Nanohaloarchaea archaeon]|nr:30S ribosomal protein S2 [Candidatus Nanohaloarchaea archaeon]